MFKHNIFDINDCKYEYLLYNSKKCATETLKNTFLLNNININPEHIHYIEDMKNLKLLNNIKFNKYLKNTLNKNNIKLNIITIIRDPVDKIVSEFYFENYWFKKYENFNKCDNLNDKYYYFKQNISFKNSLNELINNFNIDIKDIVKYDDYYIYDKNELFKLYILKFNNLILEKEKYIKKIFNINVNFLEKNLSSNIYDENTINEIKKIKNKINKDTELLDILKKKYYVNYNLL